MNPTSRSPRLLAIMLGAVRAGAWMMVCPPFNSRLIPGPVKALLSVGAGPADGAVAARRAPVDRRPPTSSPARALQVFIGAALGFITPLLFAAIQAAGDLLDVFGGFTLAMAYDPLSQSQSSIFGRFYNLIAVTLLFASDGHQLVLRGFLQSFKTLPLNASFSLGRSASC